MNNFTLIQHITLNNFNANIYTLENYTNNIVSSETINSNINTLNNQETAMELAQILSSFDGVKKISVYDKDNNLLLEVAESL